MVELNRTIALAQNMASSAKEHKQPYSWLKWIAEVIYDGKEWEAYFAAVNILKNEGVENAKRSPLTVLTDKERKDFRKKAKQLALSLEKYLKVQVKVERAPIQNYGTEEPCVQISIQRNFASRFFIYPSYSQVLQFAPLSELQKEIACYQYAERIKSFCSGIEFRLSESGLIPKQDNDWQRPTD